MKQYVDSIHDTISALNGQGNEVMVTWVPVSNEHKLLILARDETRDAKREGATPAAKFPRARPTSLGVVRTGQRVDRKIPTNVRDITRRVDGALPESTPVNYMTS